MHSIILVGYLFLVFCIVRLEGLLSAFFAQRNRPKQLSSLKKSKETKSVENSDGDWDPYGDLPDLGELVSAESRDALMPEVSISTPSGKGGSQNLTARSRRPSTLLKPQKRWEHWTEWLQEELGDLDAELEEKDKWVLELRDIVEQKRGYAIWSKRSDKEIQREVKKNVASKSLQMPEAIVTVIKAVFLERTHTYREFRRENELACIEFRKWMIEQRGKLKKDPLPIAKCEVSKKWLLKSPSTRKASRKKGQLPPVVLDEFMEPVQGVAFASESGTAKTSSTQISPALSIPSLINWEKTQAQVAADPSLGGAPTMSASSISTKTTGALFKVDDVEMFVASKSTSDFFVVI